VVVDVVLVVLVVEVASVVVGAMLVVVRGAEPLPADVQPATRITPPATTAITPRFMAKQPMAMSDSIPDNGKRSPHYDAVEGVPAAPMQCRYG
jgi:hypothetical protein